MTKDDIREFIALCEREGGKAYQIGLELARIELRRRERAGKAPQSVGTVRERNTEAVKRHRAAKKQQERKEQMFAQWSSPEARAERQEERYQRSIRRRKAKRAKKRSKV